jgi:succinate dehydrogenase/fumarate reductase-like Fe-S protein
MDSLNTSKDFTMDVNQSFYETNMIYKRGKALDSFVQTERDRQYYNAISKCIERGGNSTDTATALQEQINFLQKLVIDQQATINRLISK